MYRRKRVRERRDDALTRVGWEQLEVLLATWYRERGYDVEHTGTAASGSKYDGGIDLKLRRPGEYVLVQVKHWNAYKVPHNDVHQLLGLMVNEGATDAILITSGEFTKAAIEAATRHGHVRLIDGNELRAMLGPLPEPVSPAASPLVARAGKRLLGAVEDRIRYGRRRHSPDDLGFGDLLLRLAVAVVFMAFVVWTFQHAFQQVMVNLQHTAAKATQAPPAAFSSSAAQTRHQDQVAPTLQIAPPAIQHPTPTEIRESKRKADEAIKVLAPNTPEM